MVQFSEAAAKDIESIFKTSLSKFGLDQTERYFSKLKNCFALLDSNPYIGSDAADIKSGYYRFIHQRHVIFYRISTEGILVVRVLHKRMDIAKHFN